MDLPAGVTQLSGGRRSVIPGAGHLAPLEQPDAFHDLLLDHLRQRGGG